MRLLGFLFLLVLILLGIGYARGWFTVSTSHAAGKDDVTVGVDSDKIDEDARAAANKLGELSDRAAEVVKSIGRKVSGDQTELEGSIASADHNARDLTVTTASGPIDLHVPSAVPITRAGASVAFDELRPATRVKLTFQNVGEERRLARVEIVS
jgi:hypothetical protein